MFTCTIDLGSRNPQISWIEFAENSNAGGEGKDGSCVDEEAVRVGGASGMEPSFEDEEAMRISSSRYWIRGDCTVKSMTCARLNTENAEHFPFSGCVLCLAWLLQHAAFLSDDPVARFLQQNRRNFSTFAVSLV